MLSFFNKRKVGINSVVMPAPGWSLKKSDEAVKQWVNPENTIAVSVHFFEMVPDIPTVKDLGLLRSFYRNAITQINGGLIEVGVINIHGVACAKTIFKIPQQPTGITYLASLTIPFERCSFVAKVQCAETGITGMRETVVANKLMATGELTVGDNGYEGWLSDPYDGDFKQGTLMNRAEQEVYDEQFSKHPLTQARLLMGKLCGEIAFRKEIGGLNRFGK